MCLSPVVPLQKKPHPQESQDGVTQDSVKPLGSKLPHDQLANRMARLFEMQRRASEVSAPDVLRVFLYSPFCS